MRPRSPAHRPTAPRESGLLLLLCVLSLSGAETPRPCVFCEIVAGTRQQEGIVYRDDKVIAFLSIGPRNPGHVLVVPLVHAEGFLDVPADTMHAMTDAAQKIAAAIQRTDLKMEGFVIQLNTGKAAGQAKRTAYTADKYHQPADEFDPTWDPKGFEADGTLLFDLGRKLANSRVWPEWKEGAEFKAEREKTKGLRR